LETICGYRVTIYNDEKFVRKNEIKILSGSIDRLRKFTGYDFKYSIEDTLNWMLKE